MGRTPNMDPNTSKRRARGFAAASHFAKSPLRSASARRGIAETRLVTHWAEIVGPSLARSSRPLRVKHDRGGHSLGGALILAVDGARSSEIEMQLPQIIEKVNAYYGYRAVNNVKLTQTEAVGGLIAPKQEQRPANVDPNTLPTEKKRALENLTDPIGDEALRDALTRLGANVMSRETSKGEQSE